MPKVGGWRQGRRHRLIEEVYFFAQQRQIKAAKSAKMAALNTKKDQLAMDRPRKVQSTAVQSP